ncbi:hypothetical protein Bbelb_078850 [Branchiostoma belcheri]|nr:hypothetical protein Bbelb_078850 [Branchiostoma belcheri]
MASKMLAEDLAEDFDDQSLTCSVCMLHFRDPRVLPCLHTFCKECLQLWVTKQQPLECPTCREPVRLPDQGVDGLRTNFYVNNLLDFAAAKKGAEPGVPCQVCEGNEEGSKSWCADCATLMCESCTAIHGKLPATKEHDVTTEELIRAERDISKFQRKLHCHKHKNQELAFYCVPCEALICTACTVIDHRPGKDHSPAEIAAAAQERKETLQVLLQQLDPRLKEIQASVKEVEKTMSNLIPSKEEAIKKTDIYFQQLVELLQERRKKILSQIDEQCRADGKALQAKKEAIEVELAGLTSSQTFCQQAVEHGSDVHVLEVGNQVQTRVKTLLYMSKELDLESNWSEFQFEENTSATDFALSVESIGRLRTNVDISKCKVVVKPAVQEFRCVAILTAVNKEGRQYVTANMENPFGTNVPTEVKMKSEGLWEISYLPSVTGSHRLEVKVNSQHVTGSPFDVQVRGSETPVLTIGRSGSGMGELDRPLGVAVDTDGNIAVVEQDNKRVQIFDADTGHSLRTFSVDGEKPYDISVTPTGGFLVTSWGENYGARLYSQNGVHLDTFNSDFMRSSHGLTVLKDGRVVVAARGLKKSCLLLQPDGSLIREIGKGQLQKPVFVAVDESRDVLFVSDKQANKVVAFDFDGHHIFEFGKKGQEDGEFQGPKGLTLDQAGHIIVGNGDGRVQMFGPDGTFIRKVATVRGSRTAGIAVTSDGYIAIACRDRIELYRYL